MSTGTRNRPRPKGKRPDVRNTRPRYRNEEPRDILIGWRVKVVITLLAYIVAAITAKLFYIQVIDAPNLQKKAALSHNQALTLFNRGRILDRQGTILAQDTILYDVFAHPDYYWKAKPADIAMALSPSIGIPVDELTKKLSLNYKTIALKKNLTKDQVQAILKARMPVPAFDPKTKEPVIGKDGKQVIRHVPIPGLDYSRKNTRNYPQGDLAAHILGYVNDGAKISSGVEATAGPTLKRRPSELGHAILDGRGNLIEPGAVNPQDIVTTPKAQDVRLTVDARLQYIAERELAKGLEKSHAKRGTVIMMDPRSGEILAFAVLPTYQPDEFYKADAESLKNWAITDVYPPGSTFKILTVASGLESGAINRQTKIMDTGRMQVGGWTIQNYDYGKHGAPGMIDLIYLLQHSSNIASAKISMMMPVQTHYQLLKNLGIGHKTGLDIPGESSGIILPPDKWDVSTHATIGYGYGMASTPIQMAAAVGSIANHGIWVTPHVLRSTKVERRRVFSEATCATMTELLTTSIQTAKTSTVRVEGMEIAGKTGTSRKPSADGRGYSPDLFTSFVGFFPARHPQVLMMVVVDSPHMAEAWGSTVAGPIFKEIAKETIGYLGLNTVKMGPVAAPAAKKAEAAPQQNAPVQTASVKVNR